MVVMLAAVPSFTSVIFLVWVVVSSISFIILHDH